MPETFAFKVSDVEAKEMAPIVEEHSQDAIETYELLERLDELYSSLEELKEIQKECSQENWDGMNELPITEDTVARARDLLFKAARLPNYIQLPSLTPTSSGWIELEWYKEKGHRFAIRLNGQGVFIYSGLLGVGKDSSGNDVEKDTRGRSLLTNEDLPHEIKDNLSRLFKVHIS
ncbi:MAG: hypothetical protein NPIRA04_34240 [Nitrospirales bacterium]|nr:MAG: hypothetical protein NPIRA04_34240 [Nitrospirales bacterium]